MSNGLKKSPLVADYSCLVTGLAELELKYTPEQYTQLQAYTQLLRKWNKVYSLTAIKDLPGMIRVHLLDGLAVVKYFAGAGSILDVGSGMGVPGILLAIMLPETKVTVLDSNSKKSAFLQQVKIELGLQNLEVVIMRVEDYHSSTGFAIITSRAFANLELLIKLTKHLLAPQGYYLALKGELGLSESERITEFSCETWEVVVPYLAAQRFLIKMTQQ